jgi:hypothetical protein
MQLVKKFMSLEDVLPELPDTIITLIGSYRM